MSQPLGFFPTTDRSKSVKAEDENYFDGEEGELWKPALLWRLVLCWWCRSTPHTVQKWIGLFKNSKFERPSFAPSASSLNQVLDQCFEFVFGLLLKCGFGGFVQKLYYACCPLLGAKIRIHFFGFFFS